MDPATVFAEWTLGRIPGEKLSLIASALLADGFDTPTLRGLAGARSAEVDEKGPTLLAAAMAELGIAQPSCEEAAMIASRRVAKRLVSGELSVRDACADIASLSLGCDNRTDELTDFFFLLDEWELAASGEYGSLAQAEAGIREAAARLLDGETVEAGSSSGLQA
ncbi:MAG: hypothetical protein WBQ14_08755 [Gaiellaceae bacterium]